MQILDIVMSQSHSVKDETIDEALKEQCFLLDRGASDFWPLWNTGGKGKTSKKAH